MPRQKIIRDPITCPKCGKVFTPTASQVRDNVVHCGTACRYSPFPQRFWEKVNKHDPNGCWLWNSAIGSDGYGVFQLNGRKQAHRISWVLINGEIPDGLWVLHHCDVRLCVRPDHLFLGTAQDNTDDAKSKHRFPVGEARPGTKLTAAQVIEIRRLKAEEGLGGKKLGKRFGMSPETIAGILRREIWRHI